MKKILKTLLIILLIILIFPVLVNAATSLDTKNQRPVVGTSIEVSLRVDYGRDVYVSEAHYYVKYDPNCLQFEDFSWTQSHGTYSHTPGLITIDKMPTGEAWSYGSPIYLKFKSINAGVSHIEISEKAPGKFKDGQIISQSYSGITINSVNPSTATRIGKLYVEGYSVSPTFNVDNYKYTLTVPPTTTQVNVVASKGEKNQTITGDGTRVLMYGDNRVRVVVTAQNGDSSTYEIMIHRTDDRSGDVSLKKLTIGDEKIDIVKGQTTYETTVSRSVESIFILAQTTDPKATSVGAGQKQLSIGENIFEIRVSSKNGITETYTIKVIRSTEEIQENVASNQLASLTVNNINIPLVENKYNYIYSVNNNVTKLNIAPVTKSTTAKYKIDGNKDLKTGFNKINITVSDTDQQDCTYTLTVYKQPKKTKKYDTLDELNEKELKEDIYYTTEETSIIPKKTLDLLNKNNLKIYYNIQNEYSGLLYQITLDPKEYETDINPNITRSTESPLTITTDLPSDIPLMIYVGDIYSDGTDLKVYTYNELGIYTDLTTSVKVVDGYVNITTNGQKNYVFSNQTMIASTFNIIDYIPMIVLGVLVLFLLIYIISKKKKSKDTISSKEPLY